MVKKIAFVACAGGYRAEKGPHGGLMCSSGCRACVLCESACPHGAISIGRFGAAEVDPEKCAGCGACTRICPQELIRLRPAGYPILARCAGNGSRSGKLCQVGCAACGLCERLCPAGAIALRGGHPELDYAKCLSCGLCAVKCPRRVFVDVRGILTPHETLERE